MKHVGNKIINYTTMRATEISSKSDKTWLISAYYSEKSEFVIFLLGPSMQRQRRLFAQAHLKLNWRDLTTYRAREVAWMSNSCTLFIDMTNVNISFEEKWQGWKWISLCCPRYLNTQRFKLLMKSCCGSFFSPLSSTYWAVSRNHSWTSFLLEM